MRLNSINNFHRTNFGVSFSDSAKQELKNTGLYYLDNYGEHSEKFELFKDTISNLKQTCPTSKISMERVFARSPFMKVTLKVPESNTRIFNYQIKSPSGIYRFGLDNMNELLDDLKRVETELKIEKDPDYKDKLLDNIV